MITMTSREFNQQVSAAKAAAENGPVIITNRGRPSTVLLKYEDYLDLTGGSASALDFFSRLPDTSHIEVSFPRSKELPRAAVFD